ncbi:pyridoxamine 5'-phosphate oxidase family protein [Robiginitalea aurantiaca]|uniref:Pyridoxamine 5'-phosphate oxidase family protein n=1 Tax=Robiginitalea aurantiaca TaxID=3056915 RepID=A0ABT7WIH8_9FLAO|nr:pyridoxamine 5'-phosphate oxidase family protein [Robiginitalea aurantiaca]MDM9632733.1 pyridoxamine 5'-phosphate oxidase family protein [Robiginitalea aurantiaca]
MEPLKRTIEESGTIENLSEGQVHKLLADHCVGSLGYIAHNRPYVVPVTYFYNRDDQTIISYATEGHKITSLRENPEVSLLVYHKEGMNWWRSVLLHGVFEELHQLEAKYQLKQFCEGVRKVLVKQGIQPTEFINEFSSKAASQDIPVVYRIQIQEWTARRRIG